MQSFLTTVSNLIREKQLPALMIGGHAVTALGHPRATYDLDLLIPKSSTEAWKIELTSLRYQLFSESSNFLQFECHPTLPLPPVDLMIVDDSVFANLFATKTDTTPIATPSVISLIALKLHAINQPSRDDKEKDWSDIIALIRSNKLSLDDPDFSATILKHGGQKAIDRIKA
ncbi:MAG: hypothetical protein IZT59_04260 [Verrucomicrobia bacterium]|jgi:hypothetical protein|nr:hypothetical protein [Verrucomicrobiota bacterium]|tara:strand:+ start:6760 stop:7275 length:516 start_codon:yes stop_codon:yes gene_type:complete